MPIVNLRIRRGALITIVVSDPKGLIEMVDPTGVNARETNLALGVISDLGYYPAKLVDHSGTQWKYVVAAPTGASARLLFDSVFSLVDQQGFQPQVGLPSLPIFVKSSNGVVLNLIAQ